MTINTKQKPQQYSVNLSGRAKTLVYLLSRMQGISEQAYVTRLLHAQWLAGPGKVKA